MRANRQADIRRPQAPALERLEARVLLSGEGLSTIGSSLADPGVSGAAPLAAPAIVYVDDDGANDPGAHNPALSDPLEDGSQEHPFDRVQEALQAVASGGQVRVADGTYGEALTVNKSVTLYGGYAGYDWSLPRDPGAHVTILDAAGLNQSVVRILNVDATVDGFTITHGSAFAGGGVYCEGGTHVIRACRIVDNDTWDGGLGESGGDGGGVYASDTSVLLLENCTITGNRTGDGGDGLWDTGAGRGGSGGGVFCYSAVIRGCDISQNTAGAGGNGATGANDFGADGGSGGGVCCAQDLVVEGCTIGSNVAGNGGNGYDAGGAGGSGGGIYASGASLAIADSTISGSQTGNGGNGGSPGGSFAWTPWGFAGYGGGVFSSCDETEIVRAEISGNTTGSGGDTWRDGERCAPGGNGAGICVLSSDVTIADSFIGWNTAGNGASKTSLNGGGGRGGEGGGLYCESSAVSVSNCIFEVNSTGAGGNGLYQEWIELGPNGGGGDGGRGGGICAISSLVAISDSGFTAHATGSGGGGDLPLDNAGAGGDGGAIYAQSSTVTIERSGFSGNHTGPGGTVNPEADGYGDGGHGGNGGALCIEGSSTGEIVDCTFTSNSTGAGGDARYDSRGGVGGLGGAVYCGSSALTVQRSSFGGNRTGDGGDGGATGGDGGGLYVLSSSVTAMECEFTFNLTGRAGYYRYASPSGRGGAACFLDSAVILGECLIQQNETGDGLPAARGNGRSGQGGGLFFEGCSDAHVYNCTIADNRTGDLQGTDGENPNRTGDGGGLALLNSAARVENCLIYGNVTGDGEDTGTYGNSSGNGGGIYGMGNTALAIVGCTIAGNRCGHGGTSDYIRLNGQGGGIYTDSTTILANSILWANLQGDVVGCGAANVSYCDVMDWMFDGVNHNISANPRFVDMAWNNYRLRPDSPCIDQGNSAAVSPEGMVDLGGNPRIAGPAVDMGAYEYHADFLPPGNITGLTATGDYGHVDLTWTNPSDADFAGVRILRKEGGYPANPIDGTVVYHGSGASCMDGPLTNGVIYYYAAFSYDEVANYSTGVTAIAMPVELYQSERIGYTTVFPNISTVANRRAMPFVMPEAGSLTSITIYHQGGTGHAILAVYADAAGRPGARLGATDPTPINSTEGWQTIALQNTVIVPAGRKIWLAWVFENDPGMRWTEGTPGRASSAATWSGGMPDSFGSSTLYGSIYSIYATYEGGPDITPPGNVAGLTATAGEGQVSLSWTNPTDNDFTGVLIRRKEGSYPVDWMDGETAYIGSDTACVDTGLTNGTTYYYKAFCYDDAQNFSTGVTISAVPGQAGQDQTVGNTTVFAQISTTANRRAAPYTMTESGVLRSVSIYHQGGTGHVILAVYADNAGRPGTRLAVTASTLINGTAGWQTIDLLNPVSASSGQKIWLAWVFENMPGIRFKTGAPGRAESSAMWSGGMPEAFGSSTVASYVYSIYATYRTGADVTAPADVSGFAAVAGDKQISLSWTNPGDADFAGVRILRKTGSHPTSPTDGTVVYSGTGAAAVDTGLTNGTKYYYKAFSYDEVPNYSEGTTTTGTPAAAANTVGNTTVFSQISTTANRRAAPYVMSRSGVLQSISIYHQGGTGHVILAVYADSAGKPGARLGVTASTLIHSVEGWQTVNLLSPVSVSAGQKIWLAWVFETMPGIRFRSGTPGRAESGAMWSGGMPASFGASTTANYIYSIYAAYT